MQKLQEKLKDTPRDAFQVSCSVNSQLNRVERLSVENKVLACNNPEGNQSQCTERSLKPLVYILSKKGSPLMPCKPAKAKKLLKKGAANVVKRFPFVIQLNFEGNNTQEVILGIDPGYENVGISARTDTKELISLEVKLRTDVSKKLTERKMYRRGRRNKLWYREARFNNRNTPIGWLAPSIQHKLDSHIRLIYKVCKLLPVSKIIIEVANFDIQKINNPEIQGKEYQQGVLFEYENTKSYLIAREQSRCQLCGEKSTKGNTFRSHHIIQRKDGGTDAPSNLALLHKKCHDELHEKGLKLKANKQFKAETFMSIIRWRIVEELRKILPTEVTFGYITKTKRFEMNLEKTHLNDAFIISEGYLQEKSSVYNIQQKRKNNRCLQLNRKGFNPSVRKQRYSIQPNDLIKIGNNWQETKGSHCKGTRIILDKKSININKIKDIFHVGSFIIGGSNSSHE